MRFSRVPVCTAFSALVPLALAAGCAPGAGEGPLVVVVSGDTQGWIVPCGCASNQSGGMPRRGGYVESVRSEGHAIVADAGGALQGTSRYDRLKFEAILRGEMVMNVAAHNLGGPELTLGPKVLRDLAERLQVPFVSANAADAGGAPLAAPLRIVEAAGRRVALIGVVSPRYATERVRIAPPRAAVLEAMQEAQGRYDAAIVLAYLPDEELRELVATLPEVDAVIGGPTRQPLRPERVGPVLLASATNQGKFLVRLDAPHPGGPPAWSAEIVELDGTLADDPRQVKNLHTYYEELAAADLRPTDTSLVRTLVASPDGQRVAGAASCRECHAADTAVWEATGHAHAWRSIRAKGAHVDPDCQRCHTTGYGLAGGFESVGRSPKRVDVGCESCHGPSSAHVEDPKVRTPLFGRAADFCTNCHDRENSPHFEFAPYWESIRHGAEAARGGTPYPAEVRP